LKVAQNIWAENKQDKKPDGSFGRYSAHMVKPLQYLLDKMVATHPTAEEIDDILLVIDTVRAIPYIVTIYERDNADKEASASETENAWNDAFRRYYSVEALHGERNPDLMKAQYTLIKQGWGLMAWKFLAVPKLKKLHLSMLRLLLALTGGCTSDVQDELCSQLSDIGQCPKEIMALACRRLIRNSIEDLKMQRKAAEGVGSQLSTFNSGTSGSKSKPKNGKKAGGAAGAGAADETENPLHDPGSFEKEPPAAPAPRASEAGKSLSSLALAACLLASLPLERLLPAIVSLVAEISSRRRWVRHDKICCSTVATQLAADIKHSRLS
jgi:hypothetical protein